MVQRVQSIYLILAAVLLISMFFMPVVRLVNPQGEMYSLSCFGVLDSSGQVAMKAYPFAILLVIMVLLTIVAVFLYKNRVVQMRICVYNMLLMAGSLVMIWFYSFQAVREFQVERFLKLPALFPIIAGVLTYMAFRAIRKDELLIRSIDRIR